MLFCSPFIPFGIKVKMFPLFFVRLNVNFFPAKVTDLVTSAYKTIKAKLPGTLRSMSLYLSNKDTEFILFKPVRVSTLIIYLNVDHLFKCSCLVCCFPLPRDILKCWCTIWISLVNNHCDSWKAYKARVHFFFPSIFTLS